MRQTPLSKETSSKSISAPSGSNLGVAREQSRFYRLGVAEIHTFPEHKTSVECLTVRLFIGEFSFKERPAHGVILLIIGE